MTDAQVYTGAALMGAAAGMRSMSAPAVVSHLVRSGPVAAGNRELALLSQSATAKSIAAAAIGELIADKLPFLPKRTKAPSLVWRALTGAFSGAAICASRKRSGWTGALLGASAAVGASYGVYELRRWAGERFNLPDPIVAIGEDLLVAGCAALVLSSLRSRESVI